MKSCMIDGKLHNFGWKAENLKLYNRWKLETKDE